ncbi:hypothetical protein HZS_1875 [Henneguya salminicola]|nr:hypothetical protein HZS_1875 [Henneguya salminicola]
MVYDVGTELNVLCVYALMTSKNEYLYSVVLHELVFLMEFNWMLKYITMDFELGMICGIYHEFPETRIIEQLLTLVSINKIDIAINFIQSLTSNDLNLEQFWKYFPSSWINRFKPSLWNNGDITTNEASKGITNNSLERYKRRMYDPFINAHANICMFVEVIRNKFEFYEQRCLEIRQNGSNIRYKNNLYIPPPFVNEFEKYK